MSRVDLATLRPRKAQLEPLVGRKVRVAVPGAPDTVGTLRAVYLTEVHVATPTGTVAVMSPLSDLTVQTTDGRMR